MKETRRSNIELLRIISMALIVFFHCADGVFHSGTSVEYIRWSAGPTINKLFTSFFGGGGDTGVGAFFLITGFYLSTREGKKISSDFFLQIIFYSIINLFSFLIIRLLCQDVTIGITEAIKKIIFPISDSTWWFATIYLLIVLICPTTNKYLRKLNKRQYLSLIVVAWAGWYTIGKILDVRYYRLLQGLFYYIVGSYFAKYPQKRKTKWWIVAFAFGWILYAISTYMIGIMTADQNAEGIIYSAIKLMRRSVLGPIAAIGLFNIFNSIEIKELKTVNAIARTTFAVYLFHAAPYTLILLWNYIFVVSAQAYNEVWFPAYMFCIVIIIFATVFCLEIVRKKAQYFLVKMKDIVTKRKREKT